VGNQTKVRQRSVRSGDVTLAVREYGDPDLPTLVAVHGYPDSQRIWEPLIEHLDGQMRVITYDVRGAGDSTHPSETAAYRTERLLDDLVAVLDATCGREPVHLVGHDWGSVQLWDAVNAESRDPRLTGRLASFTSISGPCLDHMSALAHTATRIERVRQGLHSWYVGVFHLPVLPEQVLARFGHRVVGRDRTADAISGLALYRSNIVRRLRHPHEVHTSVPVQLVVATRDPYVLRSTLKSVPEHVDTLRWVEVDCGHWLPRTHAAELARFVVDWAVRP
jgi:pimeloyl-ACP methyl ester carboxylesterase